MMIANEFIYRADKYPNSVFTILPELVPTFRPALAQAFPEAFSRANQIDKGTHTIIEIHFTEEEAETVKRALALSITRYQFNPN